MEISRSEGFTAEHAKHAENKKYSANSAISAVKKI
jgi:hypothetical protein